MDGATTSDGCLASRKEIATDWRMTTYLGCRPRDCASGSAAAVVAQCMRPEVGIADGHAASAIRAGSDGTRGATQAAEVPLDVAQMKCETDLDDGGCRKRVVGQMKDQPWVAIDGATREAGRGEDEVGSGVNEDTREEKEGPEDHRVPNIGLINANPYKAGPKAPELVISAREVVGQNGLTIEASDVLPAGPEAGEIPGRANVPGAEDLGFVTVPPAWAGDGDGARNESCSTAVGGGMTGGN
ncbi:hypothetical protein GW17_00009527 [Ensete ventricosum]|nr:hypothetical protein GW17_00009527 [Ensete ventricosum]